MTKVKISAGERHDLKGCDGDLPTKDLCSAGFHGAGDEAGGNSNQIDLTDAQGRRLADLRQWFAPLIVHLVEGHLEPPRNELDAAEDEKQQVECGHASAATMYSKRAAHAVQGDPKNDDQLATHNATAPDTPE